MVAGVHPVPWTLRDLRQNCEDSHRTAAGRSTAAQRKKHSHLRSETSESATSSIGNGIKSLKWQVYLRNVQ